MKLVEAESEGPVEGDSALVTPPRPPHRRVSVSLLFTLSVLIGTVVTIYAVFPPRHNLLLTEAIEHHREGEPAWDLTAPSAAELHAWAIGVVGGKDPPVPGAGSVIGARRIEIFDRHAAVIRLQVDGDVVTYMVTRARGVAPERSERIEGDLRAVGWRRGPFTCIGVGPNATAHRWLIALGAP
jgi:hypothetical protein